MMIIFSKKIVIDIIDSNFFIIHHALKDTIIQISNVQIAMNLH